MSVSDGKEKKGMVKILFILNIIMMFLIIPTLSLGAEYTLIPKGASWVYLDNGTAQGTTWRNLEYDDSSWSSGTAVFGFGGGQTTLLTSGKTTYYFRKTFNIANTDNIASLIINLLRDDGAIVYLNGTEVLRENMRGGTITANTLAVSSTILSYQSTYFPFSINTALLREGANVIAIEIHQYSINANLFFDLQLSTYDNYNPVLVSKSGEWKYLANGSDQGTAWRDTSFNDSTWSLGTAEIGFGDTGNSRPEVTILTNTQWTTYYFRKTFTVSNSSGYNYLLLSVLRDDGAVIYINGTEVWRPNMLSGSIFAYSTASSNVAGDDEATFFTTSINPSYLVEGINTIAVEVHQIATPGGDVGFDLQLTGLDYNPADYASTFITKGSTWKYRDDGSNQGTAWRAITFDDSTWSTGQAELGFGDGPVNGRWETTIFTNTQYTTYYFRKAFTVTNATTYAGLTAYILRDDGAVVYLNDTEVFRTNMPSGLIFSYTTASSNVASGDETTYFAYPVNPAQLIEGTNQLAVEVHQQNFTAPTDLSFDLLLQGNRFLPSAITNPPVSEFSGTPLSGYGPLTAQFTHGCTNAPTKWIWDFGDGGNSAQQNPQYIYGTVSVPTTYTVKLVAGNPLGDDTVTKLDYISVTESAPLKPNLLVPVDCATTHNHQPLFSWNTAEGYGDMNYTLQLARDNEFLSIITTIAGIADTEYTPTIPLSNGLIYWQMQASSPFGNSGYTTPRQMIVFDTTDQQIVAEIGTTIFYIGTWSGSTEYYTPLTLSINSIAFGSSDTVTIVVHDIKHPNATDSTGKLGDQHFLSRWWDIDSNGSIQETDITFTYTDTDLLDANIGGAYSETNLEIAKWNGITWTWYYPTARDLDKNWIRYEGITSFSDWTLSGPGGVPVELSAFNTEE
ncbi:MAG: PKD domain-containing protein [bacterium]